MGARPVPGSPEARAHWRALHLTADRAAGFSDPPARPSFLARLREMFRG